MTNQLNANFPNTPDADDMPLRQALAQFLSDDMNDGLKQITSITNEVYQKHGKFSEIRSVATFLSIFVSAMSFGAFLSFLPQSYSAPLIDNVFFGITSVSIVTAIASRVFWHFFQYGWKELEEPMALPHEANVRIDEFLGILQNEASPLAYYYSAFQKKRTHLERRLFFGKLRYLLFSEHIYIRCSVTRYRFFFPSPADIFIRRADVEKLIMGSKPKRKAGPGREPKYLYTDAIIGLIGNPRLGSLPLDDQSRATREIESLLADWFEANADASGDVPRSDLIRPYAKKMYERLLFLAPATQR